MLRILAIVAVGGIMAATYEQLAQLRANTLAETHLQMARLDMVLAEQTGRAVETIDFILRSLIDQEQSQFQSRPPSGSGETTVTPEIIRRRIMGVRQLLAVDLLDATGKIRVSSRAAADQTVPPAAQTLLARLASDPKAGLLISEPIRRADGSWAALVAKRIDGTGQSFDGMALAWLNLMYFEDFYKAVELSENGAIILHRRDGTVLARFPHEEKLIGASYAELPPFRDVLSQSIAGTLEMDSPLDSSRRVMAIRALRAFPLAVNVSVDEARVLANWRKEAWTFAAAALAAGLMLALLLFQLARRSREVEALLGESRRAHDDAEAANADLLVQMEERARAEAALRQAQRVEAVGQLTGGVAHDFNNLLTVLLGNIELLEQLPETAPFAPRLATMRAAAERGATLTGQLLAFARRQPLMPRHVDLGALIRGMTPLLQTALGSQIVIVHDLDPDAPPALVDPTQIELVLLNLIINARDAMPMGGTLRLSVAAQTLTTTTRPDAPPPGAYVCIRVTDTGTGMAPDVQARAFEPFFTTKGVGAGSGLGLSQVYGTARQSSGTAQIDSTEGIGTTISITLPQAPAVAPKPPQAEPPALPAAAPTVDTPAPAAFSRANILVVDDDPDVRSTTALLLRRLGYQIHEAADAEEALGLLRQDQAIELLLSDVVMPRTNGPELARQAQMLRPNLPVVFFSGYTDPDAIHVAGTITRLLRKPFRPAELVRMIESTLEESRA